MLGELLVKSSFRVGGRQNVAVDENHRSITLMAKYGSEAISSLVRPGDAVDVWIDRGRSVQSLISNVEVRSVGDAAAGSCGGPKCRSVTVIVPKESVKHIFSELESPNKVSCSR